MSCTYCRKSFTFATVVEIDRPYRELVAADRRRGGWQVVDSVVTEHAELIEYMLEPFAVGTKVVYLDGVYLAVDDEDLNFDGMFAHHDLDVLPHVAARDDAGVLEAALGEPSYWLERELDRE